MSLDRPLCLRAILSYLPRFFGPVSGEYYNLVDIRRIRQAKIELIADEYILMKAPNITLDHDELVSTGVNQMQAQTNLNGGASTQSGAVPEVIGGLTVKQGDLDVTDGDMSNKGTSLAWPWACHVRHICLWPCFQQ